jgi:hypothetical protein
MFPITRTQSSTPRFKFSGRSPLGALKEPIIGANRCMQGWSQWATNKLDQDRLMKSEKRFFWTGSTPIVPGHEGLIIMRVNAHESSISRMQYIQSNMVLDFTLMIELFHPFELLVAAILHFILSWYRLLSHMYLSLLKLWQLLYFT